jgi:RHH-type transcriptional regulator, proline utilization regulon repressor / proline dehydrogenase / delta 1-pyrroline-5-carboxylate dehydrogenase
MKPATAPAAWSVITTGTLTDETALVQRLVAEAALDASARAAVVAQGADLVRRIRASSRPV